MKRWIAVIGLVVSVSLYGRQKADWLSGLNYAVETQGTVSSGDHSPLWLNANHYGLSSTEKNNGYVRGGVFRALAADSLRKWGIGYGLDLAIAGNFTGTAVVQQAYLDVRWLKGVLTVGSKQQPMELKNNELSSGSQTLGINARPVPQMRISLPDYWNIPGLNGWLALKGHIAYGRMTDGGWQESFNTDASHYQKNVWYHSKAGYLRIGDERRNPLMAEAGLEMATLFGGNIYRNGQKTTCSAGIKEFFKALIPFKSNNSNSLYTAEGDMLGSVLLSVSYKAENWKVRAYMDHFFEDGSAMYLLDYDGYGEGADWDNHKKNRYLLYDPKDGMYGVEVTLPRNCFVTSVVAEYLYTKYQSGPIYYDHSETVSDHIGGADNYYNHGVYTGWQHWGQVIGNPLYLSPLYNEDGSLTIKNNRFVAWHFGLSGDPSVHWHYRLLLTRQKGWGTYSNPYTDVKKNTSWLAEVTCKLNGGWWLRGAASGDHGELMGNNTGFQMTIGKTGFFWRSRR